MVHMACTSQLMMLPSMQEPSKRWRVASVSGIVARCSLGKPMASIRMHVAIGLKPLAIVLKHATAWGGAMHAEGMTADSTEEFVED